jgi:hypothetical protein
MFWCSLVGIVNSSVSSFHFLVADIEAAIIEGA